MIAFFYGTTGELIKIAPLLQLLHRDSFITACTGQQIEQIPSLLRELQIPKPDLWLRQGGRDLSRLSQIPFWCVGVATRFLRHLPRIRDQVRAGEPSLVIVHGDTFTTVLGAIIGRLMGLRVAHIEAGLRSFDWRHPFPEELDRIAVSRLADIHFAPDETAVKNLSSVSGEVINTHANTVKDALQLLRDIPSDLVPFEPAGFGLVSLHRNELLQSRARFSEILALLREHSRALPLVFIDHPPTTTAIVRFGLTTLFDDRFLRVEKQPYPAFISLLKRSRFLVTDSGGVQEECFYLDHPCLVHRKTTERQEGIGRNVVISALDLGLVQEFLDDPGRYRAGGPPDLPSPSRVILDYLCVHGYARAAL